MDEFEEWMKKAPMSRSGSELDRRIERACQETNVSKPAVYRMSVPLWACAAACLVFTAAGLITGVFLNGPGPGADGSWQLANPVPAAPELHRVPVPYNALPVQETAWLPIASQSREKGPGFDWERYFDEREVLVRQQYPHLPDTFTLLRPSSSQAYEARMDRYTKRRQALEKRFNPTKG